MLLCPASYFMALKSNEVTIQLWRIKIKWCFGWNAHRRTKRRSPSAESDIFPILIFFVGGVGVLLADNLQCHLYLWIYSMQEHRGTMHASSRRGWKSESYLVIKLFKHWWVTVKMLSCLVGLWCFYYECAFVQPQNVFFVFTCALLSWTQLCFRISRGLYAEKGVKIKHSSPVNGWHSSAMLMKAQWTWYLQCECNSTLLAFVLLRLASSPLVPSTQYYKRE